jgi:Domain of unknown function (DUF5658)
MNDDSTESQRGPADRRNRPTSPLDAFRPSGRRVRPRRSAERLVAFFTDRFDAVTLAMVVALLSLTIADGMLTLELLEFNSEEANPFMRHLLKRGPRAFLIGKYVLTAMGLPFLVVYQNYPMFKTRFRVGYLLPVFISLYLALISYQWMLFQAGRTDSPIVGSDPGFTADSRAGVPVIEVQGNPHRRPAP